MPREDRKIMLGIHELWLFIVSGLLLNVTPGPDTAYIIGRYNWDGAAARPRRSASAPAASFTCSRRRSDCRRCWRRHPPRSRW
jgi:hypothetical protein